MGTASPIWVVPLVLAVTGLPDRASVPAAERSNCTSPRAEAVYVQLNTALCPAKTCTGGGGADCDCSITPPVPDTTIEACTFCASTMPGLSSCSETVNVSLGNAPGGMDSDGKSRATALKMMTVHCIGPTDTAAPPVESIPAPEDPRVAVPSSVPWTVQTNLRVAPAGMSCGSGVEMTVTKAGALIGSNCTASASEPPSFMMSAEMSKVGPAGWLDGAVSETMVRWAGVTTRTEAFTSALTML